MYEKEIEDLLDIQQDVSGRYERTIDTAIALMREAPARLAKLDALEAHGVDNWEWYDDAISDLEDM